jgi:hypothetical protein
VSDAAAILELSLTRELYYPVSIGFQVSADGRYYFGALINF